LSEVFERRFSFCEWYQEPGCCRQMPCAVTGFATEAERTGHLALRMVASHDFQLEDPDYPTGPALQRLVLVRDPLFVLTSWWALDLLTARAPVLRARGLNPEKLFYLHEPAALAEAWGLISEEFVPPAAGALQAWLEGRKAYLLGFARKWAGSVARTETGARVIDYDARSDATLGLLDDWRPRMSAEQQERLDRLQPGGQPRFAHRANPFAGPTPEISGFLEDNAGPFLAVAAAIAREDATGLLKTGSAG
jgi:hypothetical protein